MRYFDCFVRSRLTYGCQTWSITKSHNDRLDACQRKLLRQMIRGGYKRVENECKSCLDLNTHLRHVHENIKDNECKQCKKTCSENNNLSTHITNVHTKTKTIAEFMPYIIGSKKLMQICKANSISKYILKQQIKYAAHLIRAPNSVKNKQLLFNTNVNVKKGRVAQDLITAAAKELNIEVGQFHRVAIARKEELYINTLIKD